MGCSICRGHAHQVCSAPGCRDETKDIEVKSSLGILEDISESAGGWREIVRHPLRCDLCNKVAVYAHPKGGLRCGGCPRPNK